jgi:pimeloyl-ACP methyl ester carboxylesterase
MGPMAGDKQYSDGWWESADGLRLHYRDYAGPKDRLPLICIPGLTRNARDFAGIAERVCSERRVICVELRGRGESAHSSDPSTYQPLTYLSDLEALLAGLKLNKFVAFGTSLGGILTLLLAVGKAGRIGAAIINDIGPVIEPAGLQRIASYVGKSNSWPSWVHAARGIAEIQAQPFPDYNLQQWIAMAKRLCRLTPTGRIVPDYDMKISEPMKSPAPLPDLWPMWDALGDAPVLLMRGALSDLLTPATARAMVRRLPNARLTTVPGVGHAPALDEPAAIRAILAFLKSAP